MERQRSHLTYRVYDLLPKDKQEAIEIVMEQKAGKKMQEQESGEKKDPGADPSIQQKENMRKL